MVERIFNLAGWVLIAGSLIGFLSFTAFYFGAIIHSLVLLVVFVFAVCGILLISQKATWEDYVIIAVLTVFTTILQWR